MVAMVTVQSECQKTCNRYARKRASNQDLRKHVNWKNPRENKDRSYDNVLLINMTHSLWHSHTLWHDTGMTLSPTLNLARTMVGMLMDEAAWALFLTKLENHRYFLTKLENHRHFVPVDITRVVTYTSHCVFESWNEVVKMESFHDHIYHWYVTQVILCQ